MKKFAACFPLLLLTQPASAHPHVWVDTIVTALVEDGKITALREDWTFDEDFTASVVSDIRKSKGPATDRQTPFSAAEIARLKKDAFSNLKNYDYFTHIWHGGKAVKIGPEVSDFSARMDGDKLRYVFQVSLPSPIEAKTAPTRIGIWDDSYYVDVGPVKGKGAAVEGNGAESCHARIIEDKDHPLYYGSVLPQVAEISC